MCPMQTEAQPQSNSALGLFLCLEEVQMAVEEQIITLKIRYDTDSDACEEEEDCCGVGNCPNRVAPPEEWNWSEMVEVEKIEVLNASPAREVP